MLETAAVLPNEQIGPGDLGIWSDDHVPGLSGIVEVIHRFGARAGAQIGPAGRQLGVESECGRRPGAVTKRDHVGQAGSAQREVPVVADRVGAVGDHSPAAEAGLLAADTGPSTRARRSPTPAAGRG